MDSAVSQAVDAKEAKGKVHSEVKQAFTAVRLAQRAGAPTLAHQEFLRASRALTQMTAHWHESADRDQIAGEARETIALAVAAQRLAVDRASKGTRAENDGQGKGNEHPERRDPRGQRIN